MKRACRVVVLVVIVAFAATAFVGCEKGADVTVELERE